MFFFAEQPLVGLQSRFGDNRGQIACNLTGLSPKRDCGSMHGDDDDDDDDDDGDILTLSGHQNRLNAPSISIAHPPEILAVV